MGRRSGTVPERFHVMENGEWVIDHPFSTREQQYTVKAPTIFDVRAW